MSFINNVLKLASGTAVAQLIGVILTPILTRIYLPEHFGTLALFVSITTIIGSISCLRYELAIVLPEQDDDAINILSLSFLIVSIAAAATGMVFFFWGKSILHAFNADTLIGYTFAIPLMVFLLGICLCMSYWLSRRKKFGLLSFSRIVQAAGTHPGRLGLGLSGFIGSGSLLIAQIFGQSLSAISMAVIIWKDIGKSLSRRVSCRRMLEMGKRYRDFPLYSTGAILLNTMSLNFSPLMLASFFDSQIVGFFALGRQILNIPLTLIGHAISQVYFQRASEAFRNSELPSVVEDIFRFLISIGLFPFLLLTFVGKDFFIFLLGGQWSEAGVYAQMLSLWTLFAFISIPLSTTFNVVEKQQAGLFWNMGLFASRLIALAVGGYFKDPRLAIALFAMSGVLGYVTLLAVIFRYAKVSVLKNSKFFILELLYCLPFLACSAFIKIIVLNKSIYMFLIAIIFSLFYIIYFFTNKRKIFSLSI